jgi:hypothetical protein
VRVIARVLWTLLLLMGLVFIGQGVGLIPGSFMTGRIEWAVIGSVLAGTAALLLWFTSRRKAA